MADISRVALFGKLNTLAYQSIESATVFCTELIAAMCKDPQLMPTPEGVAAALRQSQAVELSYDDTVVGLIASRCTEPESGGRMIDAILTNTLLPQVGRELLERLRDGAPMQRVTVGAAGDELTCRFE
jgi:hypothetical protein